MKTYKCNNCWNNVPCIFIVKSSARIPERCPYGNQGYGKWEEYDCGEGESK